MGVSCLEVFGVLVSSPVFDLLLDFDATSADLVAVLLSFALPMFSSSVFFAAFVSSFEFRADFVEAVFDLLEEALLPLPVEYMDVSEIKERKTIF